MENITSRLQEVLDKPAEMKAKYSQIVEFGRTIAEMNKIISIEKPEYSFPLVNTLDTSYQILNSKKKHAFRDIIQHVSDYDSMENMRTLYFLSRAIMFYGNARKN